MARIFLFVIFVSRFILSVRTLVLPLPALAFTYIAPFENEATIFCFSDRVITDIYVNPPLSYQIVL